MSTTFCGAFSPAHDIPVPRTKPIRIMANLIFCFSAAILLLYSDCQKSVPSQKTDPGLRNFEFQKEEEDFACILKMLLSETAY